MPFTLTMPKLSPTMEEGTLVKWHKKVGDFVEANDLLFEVATDKATVEHNALDSGWLRQIIVQEGQEAKVNQPVAIFTEEEHENLDAPATEQKSTQPAAEKPKPDLATSKQDLPPAPVHEEKSPQVETPKSQPEASGRVKASPLAKKIAEQKGLDLSKIKGSGPGQRIMSRDLKEREAEEKAQPATMFSLSQRPAPEFEAGSFIEEPLTPVRKIISQRLQEAKSTIPHYYLEVQIDADPLYRFRHQASNLGVKVTVNDCLIKACAIALKEHPIINSGFNAKNQTILRYQTVDISVAVSIKDGLITPIIKHANYKTLGEISAEVRELARRAKEGKLEPKEFQGGSFTISNLGMYGISSFQPIINPPQAAILGVNTILERPVVKHGAIVPGKVLNLNLSCDHRVIDGAAGAEFLQTLKNILENPLALML